MAGLAFVISNKNELSVRVDMSTNDQLYVKKNFNKGKDLKFRYHRAPVILNATCKDTAEGRCLGNTLFEQGGCDNIKIENMISSLSGFKDNDSFITKIYKKLI